MQGGDIPIETRSPRELSHIWGRTAQGQRVEVQLFPDTSAAFNPAFDVTPARLVTALITERGDDDKIWGSMVKQTLKRRRPGFAEGYYGYRSFNELLEDARDRGLLALAHDEKSGGYVIGLV